MTTKDLVVHLLINLLEDFFSYCRILRDQFNFLLQLLNDSFFVLQLLREKGVVFKLQLFIFSLQRGVLVFVFIHEGNNGLCVGR